MSTCAASTSVSNVSAIPPAPEFAAALASDANAKLSSIKHVRVERAAEPVFSPLSKGHAASDARVRGRRRGEQALGTC
jgi:hypothetical protein